jgi:exopolysaccharide biosynthesis polyprenyl glycosylphosphotransferase
LIVSPGLVEVTAPRLSLRPTAGLSLLEVQLAPSRTRIVVKALMDRTLGALFLVAAAPVVLLAALMIRLTSPGPAFFRQTRVGVDGAHFTMWKLRSMYVDADERRAALEQANEAAGVLFKIRRDPRVTPVGRVLRRLSLDELPQLLNVVTGDMSLVGPRPPLAREVAEYEDQVHRRLRVKPGLTGLWQVSGRSDLSWEESIRLDLRYVDNWSASMDLMILWKTMRAVLAGRGAY